ncbi:replication endonuclease [Halopseudomonas sp.]|uniref:replication endonuclease n=1 Tax=Halopseudomonas sp. TaxID=2901191 RepID=UPI00300201E2
MMTKDHYKGRLFVAPDLKNLPPAGTLSLQYVGLVASQIAYHFKTNQITVTKVSNNMFTASAGFYGLTIEGTTEDSAKRKSVCFKYWKSKLEKAANMDRLNWEAERKIVGGPGKDNHQIYCSDVTLKRYREKAEKTLESLKRISIVKTTTGEVFSMAELAKNSASRRLSELYFVAKNLESMAKEKGLSWIFVTFTAPPEFHPNPSHSASRCSYNKELGLKSSHKYISTAWVRIRSYLSKNGLKFGTDSCYGFRTAETHKDGSVHWHLQVFLKSSSLKLFRRSCKREFPRRAQVKIVVGDDSKGSASGYIFKYLMKDIDVAELPIGPEHTPSEKEQADDGQREQQDLASIRNSSRVKAVLRAMNIRQYQLFGIGGAMTLIREINKIDFNILMGPHERLVEAVKREVWRAPEGLKNLFFLRNDLGRYHDSLGPRKVDSQIELIKEATESRYGEKRKKVVGVVIGQHSFGSSGTYVVLAK